MNILIVDSTFWATSLNRDKTLKHIAVWTLNNEVTILTTASGINFYQKKLTQTQLKSTRFIKIPLSSSFNNPHAFLIISEFIKRIVGSFFVKLNKKTTIYTVSAIISDVIIAYIVSVRNGPQTLKTIITFDNFVPKPQNRPGNVVKNLIPFIAHKVSLFFMKKMDLIFAYLTPSNAKYLGNYLKNEQNIYRFENGIDLQGLKSVSKNCTKKFDFVYLGRVHVAKGIWDFIYFVKELKIEMPEINAVIMGKSEKILEDKIKKFLIDNELEQNIQFLGFVDIEKKYQVLAESKIFISFSYDDSFPVSALEAMASKLPLLLYSLDIYKEKPYSTAYSKIIPIGQFNEGKDWALKILRNYEDFYKELDLHYGQKTYVRSYEENATEELRIMAEAN